mgnify:CR=1 FL=1
MLNKADAADPFVLERLRQREPEHVIVSARTGEGIDELKQKIADTIPRPSIEVKLLIPYSHGEIISRLHEWDAEIKSTDFVSDGTFVVALVREDVISGISWFGCDLDPEKNVFGVTGDISTDAATLRVLVIPTDEELVIARDVERLKK